MNWKEALRIEDPKWIGIGKHIASITKRALDEQSKSATDLTNHLRSVGNQYIEVEYVDEYLSGNASFGCFFPQFRDCQVKTDHRRSETDGMLAPFGRSGRFSGLSIFHLPHHHSENGGKLRF